MKRLLVLLLACALSFAAPGAPIVVNGPLIPAVAGPDVALDVFAGNLVTGATNLVDVSLTVASNSNRVLVAMLGNDTTLTVSGIAFTAGSATGSWNKLGSIVSGGGTRELEIWTCVGPSTGSITVRATFSGNFTPTDGVMGLYSLYNVDQTTPADGYVSDGSNAVVTLSTTLSSGGMVLGMIVGGSAIQPIVTGTQDYNNAVNQFWAIGHNAASGTMTWSNAANGRGINVANIRKF